MSWSMVRNLMPELGLSGHESLVGGLHTDILSLYSILRSPMFASDLPELSQCPSMKYLLKTMITI